MVTVSNYKGTPQHAPWANLPGDTLARFVIQLFYLFLGRSAGVQRAGWIVMVRTSLRL